MASPLIFSAVPERAQNNFSEFEDGIMRSAIRPQLGLIEDTFFKGEAGKWPKISFPQFVNGPIVAGYVLGTIDGHLQFKNLCLSSTDILLTVMKLDNDFRRNGLDIDLSEHFAMQQSTFKFGLDIGLADVRGRLAATGPWEYVLLAHVCNIFLKYDDVRTLKLNLEIFCNMIGIPQRDEKALDEIIKRWDVQKRFSMKWAALNGISSRATHERDRCEALKWTQRWAQQGDSEIQDYLTKKYSELSDVKIT